MSSPSAVSAASSATDVPTVVADLLRTVPKDARPVLCLLSCTVDVDMKALGAALGARLPGTAIVGTTSCQRVASDLGASSKAAALLVWGDGFTAGAASGSGADADAVALGRSLTTTAMARAKLEPAGVRLVIVHATPGLEEGVLEGLGSTHTANAVVIGGSGADDDLSGRWKILGPDGAFGTGAAVLVCDWPWTMAVSYQGGYLATEHQGHITAAVGRCLVSIDHKPAVEVYERWLGTKLPRGKSILPETTMHPFGLAFGVGGGLDVHVLVHPERVNDDGSINCFAEVQAGDRVLMMEASTSSLIRRGGLVSRYAMQQAGVKADDVVAGFLIYCAGCSRALGNDVVPMTDGVKAMLPGVPFLMPFTYGEQGRLRRNRIDHGNLMLSALLLTTKPQVR